MWIQDVLWLGAKHNSNPGFLAILKRGRGVIIEYHWPLYRPGTPSVDTMCPAKASANWAYTLWKGGVCGIMCGIMCCTGPVQAFGIGHNVPCKLGIHIMGLNLTPFYSGSETCFARAPSDAGCKTISNQDVRRHFEKERSVTQCVIDWRIAWKKPMRRSFGERTCTVLMSNKGLMQSTA